MSMLRLLFAGYKKDKHYLAFLLVTMVLGISTLSAVLIINQTAVNSFEQSGRELNIPIPFWVSAKHASSPLLKADYAALRRLGFTQLVAIKDLSLDLSTGRIVSVRGLDFAALASYTSGKHALSDSPVAFASTFIIHHTFAEELGLDDGGELKDADGNVLPSITISEQNGLGRELLTDIATAMHAARDPTITMLWWIGDAPENKRAALESALPSHLVLKAWGDNSQGQDLSQSFRLNLLALGSLAFLVSLFIVANTFMLLIQGRIQRFRLVWQLGVSGQAISALHLFEILCLSLISSVLGVWLGSVIASTLAPGVADTLRNLYSLSITFSSLNWLYLWGLSFIALLMGALLALLPALNTLAGKTKPELGLNTLALTQHKKALITSALMFFSLYVLMSAEWGLLSVLLATAGCLLAGCYLMVIFLPQLLTLIAHYWPKQHAISHWLASDSVRIAKALTASFVAFTLAITASIGMNFMVNSFENATEHWLEQRLQADVYIYTRAPEPVANWVQSQPHVKKVYQRLGTDYRTPTGATVELRALSADDSLEEQLLFDQISPTAWQAFSEHSGVFISQQYAYQYDKGINDQVSYELDGEIEYKDVVGIYSDYGNSKTQIMLPRSAFTPTLHGRNFLAIYTDTADVTTLVKTWQDALARDYPGVRVVSSSTLRDISMSVFERTFVITDSLALIMLAVASLSLATSIIVMELQGRQQHGLLRSLGIQSNKLMMASLGQYLLLALLSILLAIPLAIGLSWVLINVINVQAFHWHYPLELSSSIILDVATMSIFTMMLAVLWPTWHFNRQSIVRQLA